MTRPQIQLRSPIVALAPSQPEMLADTPEARDAVEADLRLAIAA